MIAEANYWSTALHLAAHGLELGGAAKELRRLTEPVLFAPHFRNEDAAFAYVEAHLWPDGPVCRHCGNVDAARIGRRQGKSSRPGFRKCQACRKTFTVRIGRIFEDSHFPMHLWLQAIHLICHSKKGVSTRQVQQAFNCSMKTARFLMRRIRTCMSESDTSLPGGSEKTVESDETFVGGKARNRAYYEPAPKQAVAALVERGGKVRSRHVPTVTADRIRPILEAGDDKASHLRIDESDVYLTVGRQFASHETVNHSAKEHARDDVHTNTVEGVSRYRSAAFMVFTSMSAKRICIAIWRNLTCDMATAQISGSMTYSVPRLPCKARRAVG